MNSPKKNIRIRLLLYFVVISFLPLIITGYFSFKNSEDIIKKETFDHLISVSILKQEEINSWINQQAQSLVLIGEIIKNNSINSSDQPILEELLNKELGFFELFILDKNNGQIVVSTNKNNIGKIKISEEYFKEGKNKTFIKNIYYSLALGQPALTISTPLNSKEGSLESVLIGRIKLEKINEIMKEKVGLSNSGETYLVNKFNFLVSGEETSLSKKVFKDVIYTEATKECLKHNNGLALYDNYDNIPVIGAYTWIEERNVCLLAEINQSEAFRSIEKLRVFVFLVTSAILLVITLLGLIFSRTITKPLLRLIKGTNIVSKGNLKYKINVDSKDEIGTLANSFNKMTKALNKSYEELKGLDKMKDEFISMASHELRTPISAIKGFVSMTLEGDFGEVDDKIKKTLKIIEVSNNRLGKLVNDLLDVSRIEQKRLPIELEEVNLEKIVKEVTEQLILKIKEKNLNLELNIPKNISPVLADEDKLKQVFINLIDNAIKYTNKGGIEISAKEESSFIKIIVKDSGIGIAYKDQEGLFTKFNRVKNNKTAGIEGTGLGLWITKRLIRLMNGKIYLSSIENKGTEITLIIPKYKK